MTSNKNKSSLVGQYFATSSRYGVYDRVGKIVADVAPGYIKVEFLWIEQAVIKVGGLVIGHLFYTREELCAAHPRSCGAYVNGGAQ